MPEGSGEVSGDGLGAAGLSLWDPVPVTCWAPSPHLRSDLGGVLVPPFLKEGRKSPCATAHPVIWGRWQPRGSEDTAPCSTAACLWENPEGPQDGYLDPIFSEIQLQMATGGCQRCPKPQPSTALKYLYRSEGKASPWCGWEPPATGFPCEGGRWSPL